METVDLPVSLRTTEERAHRLRLANFLPGVVYGQGRQTLSVKMPYQQFRRIFEKAAFSTLLNLDVGDQEKIPVLVHDVQYDPVSDDISHVDFYAVRMDQKVTTHVALEFIGVSEAVKLGALLQTVRHEVNISCLPKDLVHTIAVDISVLQKIGDVIRVKDLKIPEGVEILTSAEEPIVSAVELKIVEETPVVEAAAVPAEGTAPAEGETAKAPAEGAATGAPEKAEKGKAEKGKSEKEKK